MICARRWATGDRRAVRSLLSSAGTADRAADRGWSISLVHQLIGHKEWRYLWFSARICSSWRRSGRSTGAHDVRRRMVAARRRRRDGGAGRCCGARHRSLRSRRVISFPTGDSERIVAAGGARRARSAGVRAGRHRHRMSDRLCLRARRFPSICPGRGPAVVSQPGDGAGVQRGHRRRGSAADGFPTRIACGRRGTAGSASTRGRAGAHRNAAAERSSTRRCCSRRHVTLARRLPERQPDERVERRAVAEVRRRRGDRGAGFGGLEAEVGEGAERVLRGAAARGGGAERSRRGAGLPILPASSLTMRWASLGPTPLARATIALSPWAMAVASSAGSRVERMASATRPPTPWTLVSWRNASRSPAEPKREQGHAVLAHLEFGEQHDLAADRADRVERAAAGEHGIADARDIEHGAVGGSFGEECR